MQIPRATYRLQFNGQFRLSDALALVPYLHDLGVSHIYASPLFKAAPHSDHGYDVSDFSQLNPELGTDADLERLVAALRARKMGLILDIVPNHMGIATPENAWWWDVLTHGEKSPHARHFDIDWKPSDKNLHGKVLVPILGDDYELLVQNGELKLVHENGGFVLGYHEHRFPIAPETAAKLPMSISGLKEFNSNHAALDRLIRRQHYELAHHEHGDRRINYRRFFAVSSLAAVRVEDENTFEATHLLLRRWIEKGWLDGLRVDHLDGLRDPAEYLRWLRALAPNAWIVVEKILESGESLPASWPVQGTTGYDFLNQVNGLYIDSTAEKGLTELYASFTGEPADYPVLLAEKKREVLKTLLASELNRLTGLLAGVAARDAAAKSFSRAELHESLAEIIVYFPVYRSYIVGNKPADAADVVVIKTAVHLACDKRQDLSPEVFAFIHALLLRRQRGAAAQDFVARFQQLTGAVMAKGSEDTAFYCFHRLTSPNEVGGNPRQFGVGLDDFHRRMKEQRALWPHTQLATSTHDTKRAEDVRARMNLLSETPDLWAQTVTRWSAMNACHREGGLPDRNAEYLFYQTLVGAWPLSEERAQLYMEKASHEARQHTTWTARNANYEAALKKFVSATLRAAEFVTDLERFVSRLAEAAAINSLGQTLLKLTAPGVPDTYQGSELWDFSLVDPDNRRPVDFALRQQLMKSASSLPAQAIWERRAEGLPKIWLIQKALKCREQIPDFAGFDYEPVFAHGAKADHVIAFSRGGRVVPIVPRWVLKLDHAWQDTVVELPGGRWRDAFGGGIFEGRTHMNNLLQNFPVALLVRKEND